MDPRKYLVMIKGKDQTSSVANFQLHDGTCEISYLSAPHKIYRFQSSNVQVFPLQKQLNPAQFIVTVNDRRFTASMSFWISARIIVFSAKAQKISCSAAAKSGSSRIALLTAKMKKSSSTSKKLPRQSVLWRKTASTF